jgi:hypothetical protein
MWLDAAAPRERYDVRDSLGMAAFSLSEVARCIMTAEENVPEGGQRRAFLARLEEFGGRGWRVEQV